jgi:hypothetical protein
MQVLYERCAAVDVGKDVIAVAVRLPGGDPRTGDHTPWFAAARHAEAILVSEGAGYPKRALSPTSSR